MDRIVFEQVGENVGFSSGINRNYVQVIAVEAGSDNVSADSPKSIYSYPDSHYGPPSSSFLIEK
jgi:hypothetical protein